MKYPLLATLLCLALHGASAADNSLSLAGSWRFQIADAKALSFPGSLPETTSIRLPGTMDQAGLGPKNTKSPTLEGPWRLYNYAGPAWYQREVEIPKSWSGKRVTLFLERCRWTTTVWLDEKRIGSQESLIAPHVYDLGTGIAPGKHRLTICVDNSVKMDLGRFVSALFGGTWGNMNGIIGKIELAATPPVWIDEVQVYPNLAKKSALVKVRIGNATGKAGSGALSVGKAGKASTKTAKGGKNARSIEVSWDATGGQAEVEVPVDAKPWDEFSPNLTELTVTLGGHSKTVRFGMREFSTNGVQGTQFALNGRPLLLRGTLECSIFPLTGYPPADVESWARICRTVKSYGLNFIRFHSWCPPEAAFEAADREGIIFQVEGPMANVPAGKEPVRDEFIQAEFKRIVDTYGNHPSFCLMALGNEFGGTPEVLESWVDMLIKRDPRHLYSGSAGSGYSDVKCRQFSEWHKGRGIRGPDTLRDLSGVVAEEKRPVTGHEIGEWMYWPDFKEIKKWTGVMALKNFEIIRDDLEKKHLLAQQEDFFQASGRFATLLYKEEIEVLLRTPGYGGFSLLDLHDYPTQGTAVIGPLDAFWDSKGFVTPGQFRRYCSPTVPLLRMPKRVYTSDETFSAKAELAHYGPADLGAIQPVWSIKEQSGRLIASGTFSVPSAPTGKLTSLGEIRVPLGTASAPCKVKVSLGVHGSSLGVPGTGVSNDWEIWVYPASLSPQPPAGVVLCSQWAEAKAALAEGRKVLLFTDNANPKESFAGKFLPVFWSPVWFPGQKPNTMGLLCDTAHPLFAKFPTEQHSNWQWFDLMEHAREFILDGLPADYRPPVQVIDNFSRNHKLGILFEGRVGDGSLLVSGFNLPRIKNDPVARQLLAGVYSYAGSGKFNPTVNLDPAWLEKLFAAPSQEEQPTKGQPLNAKVRADSYEFEFGAEKAIDGDPATFWHTNFTDEVPPAFPHSLQLELPQPAEIAGFTALPRQGDNHNGWIKEFEFYVSADGVAWGQPVAKGTFSNDEKIKTFKFAAPVRAKFLKLVALNGYQAKPFASLAELKIISK